MNSIKILYQDQWLVAAEKPSGLLVHPRPDCKGEPSLLKKLRDQIGAYLYPIHRIDRGASGIVLFGIDREAAKAIMQNWHEAKNIKEYQALARRKITEPGCFNFELSNHNKIKQEAISHYWPLENFDETCTLVKVQIETGKKHQIRRHFSRRCFNLLGDTCYGKGDINRAFRELYCLERLFLHACKLTFRHPILNKQIEIESELSADLELVLEKIRLHYNQCKKDFQVSPRDAFSKWALHSEGSNHNSHP